MKFVISCIGKQKKGPESALLAVYQKRMQTPMVISEYETKPNLPLVQRKRFEAERLLSLFSDHDYVVALDEGGKQLSSTQFAQLIDHVQTNAHKTMGFVIGGADGLDDALKKRANFTLSLGAMTWPHMLVRPLIVEQIYRGLCILSNHPYHRQ